eukprot:97572_1
MSQTLQDPKLILPLNPGLLSKHEITQDDKKETVTILCNKLMVTSKELSWCLHNRKNLSQFKAITVFIDSWKQYALQASSGKVFQHFAQFVMIKNKRLSSPNTCIHHQFGTVEKCIDKLLETLYGSIFNFQLFDNNTLCDECLLYLCSQKRNIETLFDQYYKEYTNWYQNIEGHCVFNRHRELLYLLNCLLKYHCFVKYILNNDKLYKKIFRLFIYYMQHFNDTKLKTMLKDNRFCRQYVCEHGYAFIKLNILYLWDFEYNIIGIFGCMKK